MRRPLLILTLSLLPALGGCPVNTDAPNSRVTARIGISATQGPAPLRISVSGADSTSIVAGELAYHWDFGGDGSVDAMTAEHTFTRPGLYDVTLRVVDAASNEAIARVDVRVGGAYEPVAVIKTDINSGPAPLSVWFDGGDSYAADDTIRDYLWDFDDGGTSRERAPVHTYSFQGTYNARLTVTTAGGVSGSATTQIEVGARNGSLQFDGSQYATLIGPTGEPLTAWTFETWFKSSDAGGTVINIGNGALKVQTLPNTQVIRYEFQGQVHEAGAAGLAGQWRHLAITFAPETGGSIYLDTVPVSTQAMEGELPAEDIVLGLGYVGKLAEARLWTVARSAGELESYYQQRLPIVFDGLVGYWRLPGYGGQTVANDLGSNGVLGLDRTIESIDPAWSVDGPQLRS